MNNFSFSSTNELLIFLKNEKRKKLIICGKNSYKASGAEKLIKNFISDEKDYFF